MSQDISESIYRLKKFIHAAVSYDGALDQIPEFYRDIKTVIEAAEIGSSLQNIIERHQNRIIEVKDELLALMKAKPIEG